MGVLRLVLAIAVIIDHSNELFGLSFTGGVVAVQVFFIISGFYIALILDRKYNMKGGYYFFVTNRALKIYPPYLVVLSVTVFISILSYVFLGKSGTLNLYADYFDVMSNESFAAQILANILIFGQDVMHYFALDETSGKLYFTTNFRDEIIPFQRFLFVPQAWSLALELTFYIVAPLFIRKTWYLVVLLLVSLFARVYVYHLGFQNDPWSYRFFPFELCLFVLGALSYKVYKKIEVEKIKKSYLLFVWVFVISVIVLYGQIEVDEPLKNVIVYSLSFLLIPFIFKLTKQSEMDRQIGELSYPIYVSHLLVINLLTPLLNKLHMIAYLSLLSVIISIVVAYLINKIVALPIEVFRQSRVDKRRLEASDAC